MRLRIHLPEGTTDWESNVALFRVGRADTCALRLESESAKYSGWEHAEISFDGEGNAFVTDLTSKNGTYVDSIRITEPVRLRNGTVIQIGTKGPRLEVLDIGQPVTQRTPVPDASGELDSPPKAGWREWAIASALGVAMLAVVGYLFARKGDARQQPPPAVAEATHDNQNDDERRENGGRRSDSPDSNKNKNDALPPSTDKKNQDPPSTNQPAPPSVPPPVSPEPADPFKAANEADIAAYRLIIADDPETKRTFPLFGAVVVGKQTLLTRATSAVQLAEFMQKKWPLSVMKPPSGARQAVREVRVHARFQEADNVEQLFFDEALLYTREPLADVAELAEANELNLEQGQPLKCIAVDHNGDPLNRFQELSPVGHRATVLKLTNLPGEKEGPRLLLVRGDLDDKYFGSPMFNDRGHLVAVYCEAGPKSTPGIHYAKLIDRGWIQLGIDTPDESKWVKITTVPPQPPSQKEPAK